ncbi:MAG TPA: DUF4440 domain-containing protein [Rhodanobacter sp.]
MSHEPELHTDPALIEVLDDLRRREPIFHRPEFGTRRDDHLAMTAEDFWEVGASGRRYNRAYVLDVLDERQRDPQPDPWETADFHCRRLADAVYLLTYTLRQGERLTRRATIWRRDPDGWKILYHQGTVVAEP